MGEVKLSGKALVDGQTYYTRVRGSYMLIGAAGANTPSTAPCAVSYTAPPPVSRLREPRPMQCALRATCSIRAQDAASVYDVAGRLVLSSSPKRYRLPSSPPDAT